MKIAVITGASSGIGREFAMQIDTLGCVDEIWLIARREGRLRALSEKLLTDSRVIPLDLTKSESIEEYKKLLADSEASVEFLINSAGFGKFGSVSSQEDLDIDGMIKLNITALVMMCKATLPYMLCGGKIINMSSVSGVMPLPYLNIYSATKAFVYNFSRALGVETERFGITVTAVCPYWMNTEFISVARDTPEGEAVNNFILLYEPAPVAAKALADSFMGRDESVYGCFTKSLKCAAAAVPKMIGMKIWDSVRKIRRNRGLVTAGG